MSSDRRIEEGFESTITDKSGICDALHDHSCQNRHCRWHYIACGECTSQTQLLCRNACLICLCYTATQNGQGLNTCTQHKKDKPQLQNMSHPSPSKKKKETRQSHIALLLMPFSVFSLMSWSSSFHGDLDSQIWLCGLG